MEASGFRHEAAMSVREATVEYLESHEAMQETLHLSLGAFENAGELIPYTFTNVFSGHYMPYGEANEELESSVQLAMLGYYWNAIVALRSVLELGLLHAYFCSADLDPEDGLQEWRLRGDRTPNLKSTILPRLSDITGVAILNERTGLDSSIGDTWDELGRWTHKRGDEYCTQTFRHANFPTFSETALTKYVELMYEVVSHVVCVMLARYPVGMRDLPMWDKFGMNGPFGGFSEDGSALFRFVLPNDRERVLDEISLTDPDANSLAEWVERQPDLTEEELRAQIRDLHGGLD